MLTRRDAIKALAGATAVLLLIVFSVVNLSLLGVRWRLGRRPFGFCAPLWAPVLGLLAAPALIGHAPRQSLVTALALVVAGIPLVLLRKRWSALRR